MDYGKLERILDKTKRDYFSTVCNKRFQFFNRHGISFKGPILTLNKKEVFGLQWIEQKPLLEKDERMRFKTTIGEEPEDCLDLAMKGIFHFETIICPDEELYVLFPDSLGSGVPLGVFEKGTFNDTNEQYKNLKFPERSEEEITKQISENYLDNYIMVKNWLHLSLLTFRGPFFINDKTKDPNQLYYCVDWAELKNLHWNVKENPEENVKENTKEFVDVIKSSKKLRTFGHSFSDCLLNALQEVEGTSVELTHTDIAISLVNKLFEQGVNLIARMGDDTKKHVCKIELPKTQPFKLQRKNLF